MSWSFEVEGQPVSWNNGYTIGRVPRTGGGGRFRFGSSGEVVQRATIVKTELAKAYTQLVAYRANEKKPKGWAPEGLIVIEYHYYLGRDTDCDNTMKFLDDGIQLGTGVNDKWFLPRAMSKTTGLRPPLRKVIVVLTEL